MKVAALLLILASAVQADVYLHNPRGSNNRLDDQNRDRNNANRLFDSQNNNRGGSNVGQVYYYAGSEIPMEWSQQHSCGNPNNHCDIIIQYMCDAKLRDGTTTLTIPDNPKECYDYDCDTDVRFGRHESYEWYTSCKYRERNQGLFTSSQRLNGNSAKYTRQNPNGARRAYECPEERDYYPYWHPSPWMDAAILTNNPERCAAYQRESQNVKGKFYCDIPVFVAKQWYDDNANNKKKELIPITEDVCANYTVTDMVTNITYTGEWKEKPAFGLEPPTCLTNVWSRDNHHGNVHGGQWGGLNWTVPKNYISEQCAMRMRYNISTGDMNHFSDAAAVDDSLLTAKYNKEGNNNGKSSKYPIVSRYFNETYGNSTASLAGDGGRDYTLRNNPQVDMWGHGTVKLQLAINTAQLGRTFQDRTHRFAIRTAPAALADAVIHNVQVRGKRGNVVQTYPGTEYDFVPNRLECRNGDYVHFQWTGSNTNPNNNAGQGRQGSDRHNVVLLKSKNYNEPVATDNTDIPTMGHWGNSYPAKLDESFLGLDRGTMQNLAIMDQTGQFGGEMSELDDAGTYFDAKPQKCNQNGIFHYMCTRNNNFSNRSQKAKIRVTNTRVISKRLDQNGGSIRNPDGTMQMIMEPGALVEAATVDFSYTPRNEEGEVAEKVTVGAASFTANKVWWRFKYEGAMLQMPVVYYRPNAAADWESIDSVREENIVTAAINAPGDYKLERENDSGEITGVVFGVLGFLGAVGAGVYCKFFRGGSKGTRL